MTKGWVFPLVKKIATLLGQHMVKAAFAKGVAKVVPVIGGVVSGGLALATFKPMAHRLKRHLSKLAHMTPEEYTAYAESVEVDLEVDSTQAVDLPLYCCDKCSWGQDNPSKPPRFCPNCGDIFDDQDVTGTPSTAVPER
ncbi:MAG: hypothetical protein LBV30_09980 [Propionibacteriaceae bacterium]|nr:hypothetical protein [Propionibacteriaceae bacterium]